MRFLKSFLEESARENTTPEGPTKLTQPPVGEKNTYPRELTKPPKPSSVSFVSSWDPIYGGESDPQTDQPEGACKVIEFPRRCEYCSNSKGLEHAAPWRRHGKIVERVWPDGRRELACHYCGRATR
jgi:hypothetical protein